VKLTSFVCWCLMVCFPISAWPQSQAPQPAETQKMSSAEAQHAAQVKGELQKRGERGKVKVTLRDKTEAKGYVSQIGSDSFQITDKKSGKITTIAYPEVDKVRKSGMSTAAKIAIAAGVGVGILAVAVVASLAASGE